MFCYALSPNDGTEWRQRIQTEAEHFVDVSSMPADVIAKMINGDKIQILVNLNGYTKVFFSMLAHDYSFWRFHPCRNRKETSVWFYVPFFQLIDRFLLHSF